MLQAAVQKAGEAIARLHDADIVHGDLTTSNMMIRESTGTLVLIDFGLSSAGAQPQPEDKAVDLYVLERAFISTHPQAQHLVGLCYIIFYTCCDLPLDAQIDGLLDSYTATSRKPGIVMSKLAAVRLRGRKRTAFG